MSLKEKVDNHPLVFFFSTLMVGFLSGLGTYQGILSIAKLEVVSNDNVLSKEKLESSYISKDEHQNVVSALRAKIANEDKLRVNNNTSVSREEYEKVQRSLEAEKAKTHYISFWSFDVARFVSPREPWDIPEIEFKVLIDDVIGDGWDNTAIVKLELPNKNPMKVTAKKGDKWEFVYKDRKFVLELIDVSTLGANTTFRLKNS